MSQHLRYRGALDLGDGEARHAEVWVDGGTAVAFVDGQVSGVLSALMMTYTEDRRLRFAGELPDGTDHAWEGVGRPVARVSWPGAQVTWPSGERWTGAEVTESQYGVRVIASGHPTRELPGARTELVGNQRWIVDGDVRILADAPRRGCGCGGGR